MSDRLSNLPDSLVHHILSFLPTKEVVGSSVLSTRWKYMWIAVPNLDFDDGALNEDQAHKRRFADFVDGGLNLRDESSIRKFSLTCKNINSTRVGKWICIALQHEVQELYLNVHFEETPDRIILPKLVCNSKSLTVLKLQSNHGMVIPAPLSLPNLKILHLQSIIYSAALSTQPLFFSCPVLSDLIIFDCQMNKFKSIIICIPSVKSFRLYDFNRDSTMMIYAENLASFVYRGTVSNDILLHKTDLLVDAYVEINIFGDPSICSRRATKLLSQLSNVKFLAVENLTFLTLAHDTSLYANLPTFPNLIYLELGTEVAFEKFGTVVALGELGAVVALREVLIQMTILIEKSPNVQHLVFDKKIQPRTEAVRGRGGTIAEPSAPGRNLSQLRCVEFRRLSPNITEFFFIEVVRDGAPKLESMVINSSKELLEDPERRLKVWECLVKIPEKIKLFLDGVPI